jgi:molybdate transport system substrate-binding protein
MLRLPSFIQRFVLLLLVSLMLIPVRLKAEGRSKQELLVGAAASLKEVLENLAPLFEKIHPDIKVILQFAASGALQQQIEQGAPIDVFISAATKPIDRMLQKNLLIQGSVQSLCGNEMVLIVPKDKPSPQTLADLKKSDYPRLALGESRSVPAGEYAEAWLTHAGLLTELKDKLVPAANVRQVLTFVESGNVSAGFVYASDALASKKVKVALRANRLMHPPIVYPMALIKKSQHQNAGRTFTKFLQGPEARRILQTHGFVLSPENAL